MNKAPSFFRSAQQMRAQRSRVQWARASFHVVFAAFVALSMIACGDDPDARGDDPKDGGSETRPIVCEATHTLVDDECVPNTAGCEPGEAKVDGECVALPSPCNTEGADLGDGSHSNPHIICDRAALEAIADAPNRGYALGANIDLSDAPWEPLEAFAGTLEGGGFAIANLKIDRSIEGDINNWGLFRTITPFGIIKNLTLSGAEIALPEGVRVGALAGLCEGQLSRITLRDASIEAANNVGGIIGKSERALLRALSAERITIQANTTTGGIIGWASGSTMSELTADAIEIDGTGGQAGGAIGVMGAVDSFISTLDGARASGVKITNTEPIVGGLVGLVDAQSHLERATSIDPDLAGERNDVGGAVGELRGSLAEAEVIGGKVSGQNSIGGVVGWLPPEASIKRARVVGVEVSGDERVGGVVGHARHSSVEEVSVDGATVKGAGQSGGVVGFGQSLSLRRAEVEGSTIQDELGRAGGALGVALKWSSGGRSTIEDVHIVDTSVSASEFAGGLVGSLEGDSSVERVSAFHIRVKLEGTTGAAGGIVGQAIASSIIADVAAHGTLQATNRAGGLIGSMSGTAQIDRGYSLTKLLDESAAPLVPEGGDAVGAVIGEKSGSSAEDELYYWNEATAIYNAIGSPLSALGFRLASSFHGWDFTNTWQMGVDADGFERPLLRSWLELAGD